MVSALTGLKTGVVVLHKGAHITCVNRATCHILSSSMW